MNEKLRGLHAAEQVKPFAYRLLESDLTDEDRNSALRALVPKLYLFGTQRKSDYCTRAERWVKNLQTSEQGRLQLLNNPSIVVAFQRAMGLELLISDGHHRNRFVTKTSVPCLVFSEEDALNIINRENPKPLDLSEYRRYMFERANEALTTFFRTLPCDKVPLMVTDIQNVEDLKSIYGVKPY